LVSENFLQVVRGTRDQIQARKRALQQSTSPGTRHAVGMRN
jgi:hypothetical protein